MDWRHSRKYPDAPSWRYVGALAVLASLVLVVLAS
jgi:hypothetical protein